MMWLPKVEAADGYGQCLLVQLLAALAQQIDLKQVIGEHDKDHLIDDQGEGARGKAGQVAKAFELSITLLD